MTLYSRIRSALQATALGAAAICMGLPALAETYDIDQLIDLSALTPEEVYRFEPNYLWVEPGDTIRFLNSTGNHTVTSIYGIWPEGVAPVSIEHKAEASVTFDTAGIYGFRCKVHGRHGMYALIIAGSPEANKDSLDLSNLGDLGRRVFERLFEEMQKDIAARDG